MERGGAGWAAVGSANIAKFAGVPGDYRLIEIGGGAGNAEINTAALQYADAAGAAENFTPDAPTKADETLLLYFTSGTTSRPSWWSTRTPPTRWATCPPCSGSAWNRATCT